VLPIESAPTQVATRRREVAKTVDLGRSPLLDLPSENDKRTKMLLIAGTSAAVLLMAFGLGVFLVWWLVT
jgi:hypothetical protein